MCLVTFCYTQRSVPCPAISREAASCRMSPSNPSLLGSGKTEEEEVKRVQEPKGMGDTKNTSPSKSTWSKRKWTNSQGLTQNPHGLHESAPGLLCMYYGFCYSVLWDSRVCKEVSLCSLCLLLGSFPYFVLSKSDMLVSLLYYITL